MKKSDLIWWLIMLIPKRIQYYCFLNIVAYATSGKYSNTVVPELPAMEALNRFEKDLIHKK